VIVSINVVYGSSLSSTLNAHKTGADPSLHFFPSRYFGPSGCILYYLFFFSSCFFLVLSRLVFSSLLLSRLVSSSLLFSCLILSLLRQCDYLGNVCLLARLLVCLSWPVFVCLSVRARLCFLHDLHYCSIHLVAHEHHKSSNRQQRLIDLALQMIKGRGCGVVLAAGLCCILFAASKSSPALAQDVGPQNSTAFGLIRTAANYRAPRTNNDTRILLISDVDDTLTGCNKALQIFNEYWLRVEVPRCSCLVYNTARPTGHLGHTNSGYISLAQSGRFELLRPDVLIACEGTEIWWLGLVLSFVVFSCVMLSCVVLCCILLSCLSLSVSSFLCLVLLSLC
jgi:hypothetical protein